MFGRPNDGKKIKSYRFSGYKQKKKVVLWCIKSGNSDNIDMVDAFPS